ncbi:hypothetical protein H8E06_00270 [bacterium]|nr:hypothetical protein [bacterium]
MLNKTSKGVDLVIYYGELAAAYDERGISYNPEKILNEGYNEIGLTKEDLAEAKETFEEEFLVEENYYNLPEVNTIREWINNKA